MKLYESDRYTWTLINLKYDENIGKYYYEFIPKYKGTYYIETHSSKEEIVYGITIQFTEIAGWKKDEVGRWYQFLDGSYPVNCWKKSMKYGIILILEDIWIQVGCCPTEHGIIWMLMGKCRLVG